MWPQTQFNIICLSIIKDLCVGENMVSGGEQDQKKEITIENLMRTVIYVSKDLKGHSLKVKE